MATRIRVNYYWEPEGWSGESPDAPNWSAAGASLDELRSLTVEAMLLQFGAGVILKEAILPPHVRLQVSGATLPGKIVAVASGREPELV